MEKSKNIEKGNRNNFKKIKKLLLDDCNDIQNLINQEEDIEITIESGNNVFQISLNWQEHRCKIFKTQTWFNIIIDEWTWVMVNLKEDKIHIVQHANEVTEYELNWKVQNIIDHLFYDLLEQIHENLNSKFLNKDKTSRIIQTSATGIAKATE